MLDVDRGDNDKDTNKGKQDGNEKKVLMINKVKGRSK